LLAVVPVEPVAAPVVAALLEPAWAPMVAALVVPVVAPVAGALFAPPPGALAEPPGPGEPPPPARPPAPSLPLAPRRPLSAGVVGAGADGVLVIMGPLGRLGISRQPMLATIRRSRITPAPTQTR
jgi:hypothetical protein